MRSSEGFYPPSPYLIPMAKTISLETDHGFVSADLSIVKEGGPLAILTHGYLSDRHSSTIEAIAPMLRERGVSTLALDLYAHGESQGEISRLTVGKALSGVLAAIDHADKLEASSVSLMGASFSGGVAILAARDRAISSLVLKCPLIDYKAHWDSTLGPDGVERWKDGGSLEIAGGIWPYEAYAEAARLDMPKAVSEVLCPTLIVHGDDDRSVPLAQSIALGKALTCPHSVQVIEGADHRFSREADFNLMVGLSTSWIIRNSAPRAQVQCCPRCLRLIEARDFMNAGMLGMLQSVLPSFSCRCGYHGLPIRMDARERAALLPRRR